MTKTYNFPAMRKKGVFHFKQFSVKHDQCTMKVGTDAVLLGSWVRTNNAQEALDIGTGCGVIALMIAQRTSDTTHIDGIEIQAQDSEQARDNVSNSPWRERVSIHHVSAQKFRPQKKYDLVVSNPPYFINSLEPPEKKRHHVRHAVALSYTDLLDTVERLLSNEGKFNVILPYAEGIHFIELASRKQLSCSRQYAFRSRKEKPVERWLLEFSYQEREKEEGEIVLYRNKDSWSDEYIELTKDFYLMEK